MAKLSEIGTECADLHYARPGLCKSGVLSGRVGGVGAAAAREKSWPPGRGELGGRPSGGRSIKFPSGTDRARFASRLPSRPGRGGRQKTPHCRRRIVPALLCYVRRAGPFVDPSGTVPGRAARGAPEPH